MPASFKRARLEGRKKMTSSTIRVGLGAEAQGASSGASLDTHKCWPYPEYLLHGLLRHERQAVHLGTDERVEWDRFILYNL